MVSINFNTRHHDNTKQVTGIVVLIILLCIFWVDMIYSNNSYGSGIDGSSSAFKASSINEATPILKILYIITSSNEYNTGDKKTTKGQDRLQEILLPVMLEGVESINQQYDIDIYLILGYTLSQTRYQMIRNQLPDGVGLEIWDDAIPLNYDYINKKSRTAFLDHMPRALARQHRYVIKDKLSYYDFFLAFEDDMLITLQHINYYRQFMNEIDLYKQQLIKIKEEKQGSAAEASTTKPSDEEEDEGIGYNNNWFDKPITIDQLDHIKPGFLRVEVMTSSPNNNRQTQIDDNTGPIIDVNRRARPDPRICCHSNHIGLQGKLAPQYPTADQLLIWETAIPALFVRPFFNLLGSNSGSGSGSGGIINGKKNDDWVAILPIKGTPNKLSGYWSGTGGTLESAGYGRRKPKSILNEYIGQSAGWMMSRREILDMDQKLCHKRFLPPYDIPQMIEDGMGFMTDSVEYWSGGLQMWGQLCEIQRVINIDPTKFSHHLIYHTANNKQIEIPTERLVKVTTLLGQLHTVKTAAIKDIIKIQNEKNSSSFITKLLRWIGVF